MVDKTFAPDYPTANRMIELAEKHRTRMFTTSALRFVPEIPDYVKGIGADRPPRAVAVRGPSNFETYAVHVLEPLVMLLGRGARAVSFCGDQKFMTFQVKYADGRRGSFQLFEPLLRGWEPSGAATRSRPASCSIRARSP